MFSALSDNELVDSYQNIADPMAGLPPLLAAPRCPCGIAIEIVEAVV